MVHENGVKLLQQINKEIMVRVERMQQDDSETSIRMPGVCGYPALC